TSGLKRAGYNGITWAEFTPEQVDVQIESAIEPFRQTGTPFTWWVGPLSQPRNLGAKLQAHGFVHNRDMIGMAANLKQLPPLKKTSLEYTFEPVTNRKELEAWMPVYMEAFSVPAVDAPNTLDVFEQLGLAPGSDWRHFVLRLPDGRIAATSSLYLGAGIAGLYNIGTPQAFRQQGLGAAITLLTYAQAREWGYQIGTLQSTFPNALRLYHRLGFEIYCKIGVYQHP
ncbi:MAG TPA: GNAT family N-acetyltransferase, partial [Anaerolineaceae bacterium]|nr:GNAT family N-acetyltransferase [Anaerolineaceae bacterium]